MESSASQASLVDAVEQLKKAGNRLTRAAGLLEAAEVTVPEVKLLREEVLDILTRVKAQKDRLGAGGR